MIDTATEQQNPKVPNGSILVIHLSPREGEDLDDFKARMESLIHGIHQMEFKRLGPAEWRLAIELNPSWDEPEEFDPSKLSRSDLLSEFNQLQAGAIHKNKIDYGGE